MPLPRERGRTFPLYKRREDICTSLKRRPTPLKMIFATKLLSDRYQSLYTLPIYQLVQDATIIARSLFPDIF